MNLDGFIKALEASHQALHEMDVPGPDSETILATLTERDLVLIGMALPLLELTYPCTHDASRDLQNRLVEVTVTQQPHWTVDGESA